MYDLVAGMSWRVALSMSALDDTCRAHPEFHVVDHEVLCRDPHAEYRKLFDAIGLDWSDEVESHIERANRPGEGYETYHRGRAVREVARAHGARRTAALPPT